MFTRGQQEAYEGSLKFVITAQFCHNHKTETETETETEVQNCVILYMFFGIQNFLKFFSTQANVANLPNWP